MASITVTSGLPPIHAQLLEAKARKGLTFEQLGKAIGKDEVWVAALLYGQAKATSEELDKVSQVLEVDAATLHAQLGEAFYPDRGLGQFPPKDPLIYRLFEGISVYGYPIKSVIHEKFGDGIMSMINCVVTVQKKPDPAGDRVLLTFDGKFLPYSKW
ncbi:cyanate hydratase [Dentipellis sp. KUC8613]|nr:cyanate hydratase [Dentipellis sp. KUC8613]